MEIMAGRQVNSILHLQSFLDRWKATTAEAPKCGVQTVERSATGNINLGSQARTAPSHLLPRGHKDFYRFIEPGVLPWVAFVVTELDLITYTSCEGHRYPNGDIDERHIGMLVESPQKVDLLRNLHEDVEVDLDSTPCCLGWMDHTVVGDGLCWRAIDIFLMRRIDSSWADYFECLDEATAIVINGARRRAILTLGL